MRSATAAIVVLLSTAAAAFAQGPGVQLIGSASSNPIAVGDTASVLRTASGVTFLDTYSSDGRLRSTIQLTGTVFRLARGSDDQLYVWNGNWWRVDGSALVRVPFLADAPWVAQSTAWELCGFDLSPPIAGVIYTAQAAALRLDTGARVTWGPPADPSAPCVNSGGVGVQYNVTVLANGEEPILSVNNSLVRVNDDLSLTTLYTVSAPVPWEMVRLPGGDVVGLWQYNGQTVFVRANARGDGLQALPTQAGVSYTGLHVEEDGQLYTATGRVDLSTGAVQPEFQPYLPSGQFVVTSDSVVFFVDSAGRLFKLGDGGRDTRFGIDPGDLLYYESSGYYAFGYALAPSAYLWLGYSCCSMPQWASDWTTIAPADFNGDGATDLFFYNRDTGQFARGLNVGACPNAVPCMALSYFGYQWAPGWDVTVGDFDRDGLSDVFLYNDSNGDWFLARSVGDGTGDFVYTSGRWATGWTITRADWGTEGAGLFLYNPTNGEWFRVTFDADGNVGYPDRGTWGTGWEIHPADFNGDGITDLFLYASSGPNAGRNFRVTTVDGQFVYEEGPVWASDWNVSILDLDGDGCSDVFLYRTTDGRYFETFWQGDHYDYYGGTWASDWVVTPIHRATGRDTLFLNSPSASGVVIPGARGDLSYALSAVAMTGRVIPLSR